MNTTFVAKVSAMEKDHYEYGLDSNEWYVVTPIEGGYNFVRLSTLSDLRMAAEALERKKAAMVKNILDKIAV